MGDDSDLKKRLALASKKCKHCCDCPEKKSSWAVLIQPPSQSQALPGSKALVGFICSNCAAAHRTLNDNLGEEVCKVLSLTTDTWTEEQVEAVEGSGNSVVNSIYEHGSTSSSKPLAGAHAATRGRFLRLKYVDLAFYSAQAYLLHLEGLKGKQSKSSSKSRKGPKLLGFLHKGEKSGHSERTSNTEPMFETSSDTQTTETESVETNSNNSNSKKSENNNLGAFLGGGGGDGQSVNESHSVNGSQSITSSNSKVSGATRKRGIADKRAQMRQNLERTASKTMVIKKVEDRIIDYPVDDLDDFSLASGFTTGDNVPPPTSATCPYVERTYSSGAAKASRVNMYSAARKPQPRSRSQSVERRGGRGDRTSITSTRSGIQERRNRNHVPHHIGSDEEEDDDHDMEGSEHRSDNEDDQHFDHHDEGSSSDDDNDGSASFNFDDLSDGDIESDDDDSVSISGVGSDDEDDGDVEVAEDDEIIADAGAEGCDELKVKEDPRQDDDIPSKRSSRISTTSRSRRVDDEDSSRRSTRSHSTRRSHTRSSSSSAHSRSQSSHSRSGRRRSVSRTRDGSSKDRPRGRSVGERRRSSQSRTRSSSGTRSHSKSSESRSKLRAQSRERLKQQLGNKALQRELGGTRSSISRTEDGRVKRTTRPQRTMSETQAVDEKTKIANKKRLKEICARKKNNAESEDERASGISGSEHRIRQTMRMTRKMAMQEKEKRNTRRTDIFASLDREEEEVLSSAGPLIRTQLAQKKGFGEEAFPFSSHSRPLMLGRNKAAVR